MNEYVVRSIDSEFYRRNSDESSDVDGSFLNLGPEPEPGEAGVWKSRGGSISGRRRVQRTGMMYHA